MNAQEFMHESNVSRETLECYQAWYNILTHWNKKINLVSAATISDFWLRHAMDSHQLFALAPKATTAWLDLGSGAGFPGLAMAILMRDKVDACVTLVESNGKKCNFLRTVIRELKLPAEAVQVRVEALPAKSYGVISARAFAPLPKLLGHCVPFWDVDTVGIFPKGVGWKHEVEDAQSMWDFAYEAEQSSTDTEAKIIVARNLKKINIGEVAV
jgi:16S rRNA (guanine527-N7)-methyltransferase